MPLLRGDGAAEEFFLVPTATLNDGEEAEASGRPRRPVEDLGLPRLPGKRDKSLWAVGTRNDARRSRPLSGRQRSRDARQSQPCAVTKALALVSYRPLARISYASPQR